MKKKEQKDDLLPSAGIAAMQCYMPYGDEKILVGLLSFVLSIVICCILIVSSSKTATTHSGNVIHKVK